MNLSIKKWFLASFIAVSMAFVGCDLLGGGDDDDEVSISLESTNAVTVTAPNKIAIDGKVKGNTDINITTAISSATVAADKLALVTAPVVQPGPGVESWDLTDDADLKIVTTAGACTGEYSLTITATAGSATTSKSHTFSVVGVDCSVAAGTALGAEKTGTVWNLIGPNQGAFNLVTMAGVSSSGAAADKDLMDVTTTVAPDFTGVLTSGNGTMFVKTATLTYATATVEEVTAAYTAGTAAASTPALAVGDIIIAKLRAGTQYALISVTAVTKTTADNLDKVDFVYKLTP